jgi:hypothetical protein
MIQQLVNSNCFPTAAALYSTMCVLTVNRGKVGHSNAVYGDIPYIWFVQKISGLELKWLFTDWDVLATSVDMFEHVLASHDTVTSGCVWSVGCSRSGE